MTPGRAMPPAAPPDVSGLVATIRCPACGGAPHGSGPDAVLCESCGRRFPVRDRVLDLSGAGRRSAERAKAKPGVLHRVAYNLHPLKSRWSPLVAYAARKMDAYYERCLTDRDLAEDFRRHYLPDDYRDSTGTVLDFGCGRGRLSALLAQLGFRVVGADLQRHEYWDRIPGGRFVVLPPSGAIPFGNGVFDCCVHFQVLTYLADPARHLVELGEKLRPGGTLSIQVTNRECYRNAWAGRFDGAGRRLYSTQEVTGLLESAGFRVERVRHEGFYAPVFPFAINFVRQTVMARRIDICDRDSRCVRLTPPRRRGLIHVLARRG